MEANLSRGPLTVRVGRGSWSLGLAAVLYFLALGVVPAQQWRGYLLLPGLAGESVERNHPGWIEVQAISEEVRPLLNLQGQAVGKPVAQALRLTHALDRASVGLHFAAANQAKLGKARLQLFGLTASGVFTNLFVDMQLMNTTVVGVETRGAAGGTTTEVISLGFAGLTYNSVTIVAAPAQLASANVHGAPRPAALSRGEVPVSIQFLSARTSGGPPRLGLQWAASPRGDAVVVESAESADGPWAPQQVEIESDANTGISRCALPVAEGEGSRFWRVRPLTAVE